MAGEVLALADQPQVELAGEQGDLGLTKVMAEGGAGEAGLCLIPESKVRLMSRK